MGQMRGRCIRLRSIPHKTRVSDNKKGGDTYYYARVRRRFKLYGDYPKFFICKNGIGKNTKKGSIPILQMTFTDICMHMWELVASWKNGPDQRFKYECSCCGEVKVE